MAVAGGCAEVVTTPPVPRAAVAERPFLLPPARGYPGELDADLAAAVEQLHGRLLAEGLSLELSRVVDALARERPSSSPVQVLLAQVELVNGDTESAGRRLEPVVEQWPTYDAALLLVGHVRELLGDLPEAFEAYRRIAAQTPLAAQRVSELRARALEIVGNRLAAALSAGDLDTAEGHLVRLESWAPSATSTLTGARNVAAQ